MKIFYIDREGCLMEMFTTKASLRSILKQLRNQKMVGYDRFKINLPERVLVVYCVIVKDKRYYRNHALHIKTIDFENNNLVQLSTKAIRKHIYKAMFDSHHS